MFNSNEFAYAKQFDGDLRCDSEPVPVKVTTRLRIMNDSAAKASRRYSGDAYDRPPHYVVGAGNLPLNPSLLQAMGRHYFTW